MAILMTAQAWGSQYEWYAHEPLALKAGLDPAIIAAIGAGRKPDNMKDDEAIVWEDVVSMTLNVAHVKPPKDAQLPFQQAGR